MAAHSALAKLRKDASVTLMIPTHNHASTVAWSIGSAQQQTLHDVNIVVIGDGVSDDTRDALSPLLRDDDRISFLDLPKGQRHGEAYRNDLIRSVESPVIAYLGDDDLLFADHLQTMVELLDGNDFAHPLPVFVNLDGSLEVVPTDLANQDCVNWHLNDLVFRNAVSLTGVVHTRDSYLRLQRGWHPAPAGHPTDLYMWREYFALPGFRGATSSASTTMKFGDHLRVGVSDSEREAEIFEAWQAMQLPGAAELWDSKVTEAVRDAAVKYLLNWSWVQNENIELRAKMAGTK